ncbi:hypothetical protein [Micromonospora aurantiaca]|uniref:helix-turn-helix domain-containing protein n=1 Tax=Micromonospora aurantiaca (nom. illeg.) TaxID=47850 RepID=UPI00380F771D
MSDSGIGVRSQGEGQPTRVLPAVTGGAGRCILALGVCDFRDGYFAGRAALLGLVPAQVMHAVFGNVRVADRPCHLGRGQRADEGRALYAGSGRSTCRRSRWPGSRRSPR